MNSWQVYRIVTAYISCFAKGLSSQSIGPSLPNLEALLGVTTKTMGLTFFAMSFGCIVGAFLCAVVFDKLNSELQLAVNILLLGVFTAMLPWMPSFIPFVVVAVFKAIAISYLEPSKNSYIIMQCPSEKIRNPVVNGAHAVWSLGACVCPFLMKPFLVNIPKEEPYYYVTTAPGVDANSSFTAADSPDDSWISRNELKNNTSSEFPVEGVEKLRYAFLLLGLTTVVPCIMFLVSYFKQKYSGEQLQTEPVKEERNGNNKQEQDENDENKMTGFQKFLVGFMFFVYGVFVWYITTPNNFLTAFTVKELQWNEQDGALVMSILWAAHGISRFLGIIVSMFLTPAVMVVSSILISAVGFTLMLFVNMTPRYVMWISAGLVGFGLGTIASNMVLWLSEHIRLTGRVAAIMFLGASIGAIPVGPIVGYLFDTYSPMFVVYICLVAISLHFVLFIIALVVVKVNKKRQEDDYEDLSLTNMDPGGSATELNIVHTDEDNLIRK